MPALEVPEPLEAVSLAKNLENVRDEESAKPDVSRLSWLLLLPVAFVVYVVSFSFLPIIEQRYDVLGDGDSAAFITIIKDFSFSQVYGDPYNTVDRSVADVAQKHKIHHIVYVAVGSVVYGAFEKVYGLFGIPDGYALYSVNALVVCLNLVLLFFLLRQHNPARNPVLPFLIFYAFALSTWVFGSVPESWPFTATLVLSFFLLLDRGSKRPTLMAVLVGLMMLNNIMLGILVVFLAFDLLRDRTVPVWRAVLAVPQHSATALATWATGLTALSVFDPMFRPDHFLAYTAWFREFTARTLPLWDPYVWKSAIANLLFVSVASNQPDPFVPQEALLTTLVDSRLGLAALVGYTIVLGLVGYRVVQLYIRRSREESSLVRALGAQPLRPAVFCGVMAIITGVLYYSSGFLYSTIVIPMLAAVLCGFLDLRRRVDASIFFLSLALIVINNAAQIQIFRQALSLP